MRRTSSDSYSYSNLDTDTLKNPFRNLVKRERRLTRSVAVIYQGTGEGVNLTHVKKPLTLLPVAPQTKKRN